MDNEQRRIQGVLNVFLGMMKAMYDHIQQDRIKLQDDPNQIYEAYRSMKMGKRLHCAVNIHFCRMPEASLQQRDIEECMTFWELFSGRYCKRQSWRWTLPWSEEINEYCLKHKIGDRMGSVLQSLQGGMSRVKPGNGRQQQQNDQSGIPGNVQHDYIGSDNHTYRPNPKRFETMSLDDCLRRTLEVERQMDNLVNVTQHHASNRATTSNKYTNQYQELYAENQDLLARIAAEFEERLARNEQDLEDVNRTNRPMKIAEEYQALCAEQWLNAKMEMDETPGDDDNEFPKHLVLLLVFLKTYDHCTQTLEQLIDGKLKQLTQEKGRIFHTVHPLTSGCNPPLQKEYAATTYPAITKEAGASNKKEREAIIIDFRAQRDNSNVPEMSLKAFIGRARKSLENEDEWKKTFHDKPISFKRIPRPASLELLDRIENGKSKELEKFVQKCLEIGWKMVTQLPPMVYDIDGIGAKWQGDNIQEVAWGSKAPTGEGHVVIMYATPGLKHGDQPMVRGKVFCDKAGEYNF